MRSSSKLFHHPQIFDYDFRNQSFQNEMKVKRKEKSIIIEEDGQDTNSPTPKPHKMDLKNIIEVTEENDPNPIIATIPIQNQKEEKTPIKAPKTVRLQKFTKCLTYLWRKFCRSPSNYEIDLNSDDLASVICKLRNKKVTSPPLLPPQTQEKRVLVLDLDQTLIHTSFTRPDKYDFESQVLFNGKNTKIFTVKRFGLDAFLFQMSLLYEIVVFTASQQLYADKVIDLIDPKHRISHRLYREHCVAINKTYYLKNIQALGRKVNDVIIVDDNTIAGLLQPDNFYKIDPFEGNQKDRQLYRLSAFLKYIHGKTRLGSMKTERKQFDDLEINLSEEDSSVKTEPRSLAERKRQYQHKKTTSQVEELATKSTEDENQNEIQSQNTAYGMVKSM